MVKIVNGEIVEDTDPRVRALIDHSLSLPSQSVEPAAPSPSVPSLAQQQYYHWISLHQYYSQLAAYAAWQASQQQNQTLQQTDQPLLTHSPAINQSITQSLTQSGRRASIHSPSHNPALTQSPAMPHLSLTDTAPPTTSPPVLQQSMYPRRSPYHSNLFGLPPLIVSHMTIPPHVYVLAFLLTLMIGPPILVPMLAAFFFYRWHLNREAEKREKSRLDAKFAVFRSSKTRPKPQTTIHSLSEHAIKE